MDKFEEFKPRMRLLPGQFSISEALTEAIAIAGEAYRLELYQEDWPEEDRRALNAPEEKGRAVK